MYIGGSGFVSLEVWGLVAFCVHVMAVGTQSFS